MAASTEASRAHGVVHLGVSIIIAIPLIGTLLGIAALVIFGIGIFVKSKQPAKDFLFLAAYPFVFLIAFTLGQEIMGLFVDSERVIFYACAATIPVSFYFIHTISRRLGEF